MSESVADWMTRSPIAVGPHTTIEEARELVRRRGVRHLLVSDCDNVLGVACTCDLERARPRRPISECMSAPLVRIDASATLDDAIDVMRERGVGSLGVVAGGLIIGILTRSDLIRAGVTAEVAGACPACGTRHHLVAAGFCRDCVDLRDDSEMGAQD